MKVNEKKRRRARGSGTVYQKHRAGCDRDRCHCTWSIAYLDPDGKRHAESSEKLTQARRPAPPPEARRRSR